MSQDPRTTDNNGSQDTQEPPDNCIAFDMRRLRFSEILRYLFFNPKLGWALCSIKPFLFTSIAAMLLLCGMGSCVITMSSLPERAGDLRLGIDFLIDTVGEVRFSGAGKLEWSEDADKKLPAAGQLKHLRMDIMDTFPDEPQSQGRFSADDRQGVVVSHDGVRYWHRGREAENKIEFFDFPDSRVRKMFKDKWKNDNAAPMLPLNHATAAAYSRIFFLSLFASVWLAQFISMLRMIFPAAICIGFVSLLFNGKRSFSGYGGVISLGVNTLIPPVLTSCIYTAAGLSSDFSAAIPLFFVVYMAFAFFEGRRGRLVMNGPAPKK